MNRKKEISIDLLKFLHAAERLKFTLRHGWASNGRQESVAEHSWRLALMVILCQSHLEEKINIEKALQMAIIHDLPEIIVGDTPFFEALEGSPEKEKKHYLEEKAMKEICLLLQENLGVEMYSLWDEYQRGESKESQLLHALDKLEAQIQQNEADISTWNEFEKTSIFNYLDRFCDYNSFLKELKEVVREESVNKLFTLTVNNPGSCL